MNNHETLSRPAILDQYAMADFSRVRASRDRNTSFPAKSCCAKYENDDQDYKNVLHTPSLA